MTTGVISELRVSIGARMLDPLVITTDHRGGQITLEGRNEQKGAHTEGEEGCSQYPCRAVGNDTSGEEVTRQGQRGMRGVDVWSPDHTFPCICDLTTIASTTDRCKRRVRRSKRCSDLASGDDPGRGMSGATWSSGRSTEMGQFLSSFGFLAPHSCGEPDTMRTVFQYPAQVAQPWAKGQAGQRPAVRQAEIRRSCRALSVDREPLSHADTPARHRSYRSVLTKLRKLRHCPPQQRGSAKKPVRGRRHPASLPSVPVVLGRSARGVEEEKSGRVPQSTQDRGRSKCVIICRMPACLALS